MLVSGNSSDISAMMTDGVREGRGEERKREEGRDHL